MIEQIAYEFAEFYHHGQTRRDGYTPFLVHPEAVVNLLQKYGYCDEETLSIGWLHDTIEDTLATFPEINASFGKNISIGVKYLTRNVDSDTYKERLLGAPLNVQAVKLCDTLHNIMTIKDLRPTGRQRKINDCNEFYIPLAEKNNHEIAIDMEKIIRRYNNFH